MGIVFRQSIKATAITFTGAVLGALVIFISSALIPSQELGFTRNLTNQTVIASFFLLFGAQNTLFYYLHRYDENKKKMAVFLSLAFLFPLVLLIPFIILYLGFSDYFFHFFQPQDVPFLKRFFLCLPLYSLFYMYSVLLEYYLLAGFKTALASFVKEIVLRVLNLGLILLYGFGFIDFPIFIYAFVFSHLLTCMLLFYFASRTEHFRFSTDWKQFSGNEYKDLFRFTWYHALMHTSIYLMGFLDALMLAPLDKEGLSVIPAYTNAVFIVSVMYIPFRTMSTAALPDFSRSYTAGDEAKSSDIFGRAAINILLATVFMALVIGCNMHNVVKILGPAYSSVSSLVLILMIGKFADCITGMNDQALSLSNHYRINFYLSVCLVIILFMSYKLLIPAYGIYGAAWGTSAAFILFNAAKSIFVWRKLGLQPFSKGTGIIIFSGLLTLAAVVFIPKLSSPVADAVLRSCIISVVYLALLIWLKPSRDLQQMITQVIKEKKLLK